MSLSKEQRIIDGVISTRAATPLAAAGTPRSLFVLGGGAIVIRQLYGVVTIPIAAVANNTKLQSKPTGIAAVDLCAVADITGLTAGQLVGITGAVANALVTGFVIAGQASGLLVQPGTIDLNCAAALQTGAIRWVMRWSPAEPNAFVRAA
jgi:hypothetical protein